MHAYIRIHIHTYIHTYTHTYIHTYIHTYYIHTHIYCVSRIRLRVYGFGFSSFGFRL